MTEKTKRSIKIIAEQNGVTPEKVEYEMMRAIRAGMATTDPHAQALWREMCPDGKEPDLDTFLAFVQKKMEMIRLRSCLGHVAFWQRHMNSRDS